MNPLYDDEMHGTDRTRGQRFREERERITKALADDTNSSFASEAFGSIGLSKARLRAIEEEGSASFLRGDLWIRLLSLGFDLRYVIFGVRA